uniref:Uncharacterized protein n=1 Tax=Panagrolaimus sp. ES5 TaxID=591445 RepID=A0AC34F8I0_9BILA
MLLSSVSGRLQSDTGSTHRVDLGGDATHHREIAMNVDAARALGGMNVEPEEGKDYILLLNGLRICDITVKKSFREFLTQFKIFESANDEHGLTVNDEIRVDLNQNSFYYMERLQSINNTQIPVLNVNLKHVLEFDESLYHMIVAYPVVKRDVIRRRIDEPTVCTNCKLKFSFNLIHNRSAFGIKQIVKLQEIPGDMPAGQKPHTVTIFVHGGLVDQLRLNDRIVVTGIYRVTSNRANPVQRALKRSYRTVVDVLHFRRMNQDRLHDDGTYMTEERIAPVMTEQEVASNINEEGVALIADSAENPEVPAPEIQPVAVGNLTARLVSRFYI